MAVSFLLSNAPGVVSPASIGTNHKDEIQIMSWSWGASQVSSVAGTGGSGAGKADLSDFGIMTYFDQAPKFCNRLTIINTPGAPRPSAGRQLKPQQQRAAAPPPAWLRPLLTRMRFYMHPKGIIRIGGFQINEKELSVLAGMQVRKLP